MLSACVCVRVCVLPLWQRFSRFYAYMQASVSLYVCPGVCVRLCVSAPKCRPHFCWRCCCQSRIRASVCVVSFATFALATLPPCHRPWQCKAAFQVYTELTYAGNVWKMAAIMRVCRLAQGMWHVAEGMRHVAGFTSHTHTACPICQLTAASFGRRVSGSLGTASGSENENIVIIININKSNARNHKQATWKAD